MIRYSIIATGSKGNAVKIDDILIDCGVSFKKLKDVYKHIRLVLLTHEDVYKRQYKRLLLHSDLIYLSANYRQVKLCTYRIAQLIKSILYFLYSVLYKNIDKL